MNEQEDITKESETEVYTDNPHFDSNWLPDIGMDDIFDSSLLP